MTSLMTPLGLSGATTAGYILFYTGYSKKTKSLQLSQNLLDVFLLRKSLGHTLVELNKALSLSGLTTLLISCLPSSVMPLSVDDRKDLWNKSLYILLGHTAYSTIKYYGSNHIPRITDGLFSNPISNLMKKETRVKGVKQTSLILGTLSQAALITNKFDYKPELKYLTMLSAVIGGTAHFYTMELDYKWVLQVRPYAYLPFPICAVAAAACARSYLTDSPL